MTSPLEGIRVLDWTVYQQGPVATVLLGDLGAEVIKIEQRESGDLSRQVGGWMGLPVGMEGGRSFYFEAYNYNKKGITLDLKQAGSREVVRRLVEGSDVFVHNIRHEVAQRLGVDYETLRGYNPRLIYAQAWGYGPEGEDSNRPTIDPAIAARCGITASLTPPGMPPHYPNMAIVDQIGATMFSYSILAALLARERLGVGQRVDSSLMGSTLWLQAMHVNAHLLLDKDLSRSIRERAPNPLSNYYRCADDQWLYLGLLDSHRHWHRFCQALGMGEVEDDQRFATPQARSQHRQELIALLDGAFAQKPIDHWLEVLKGYPEFIYDPVNTVSAVLQDPQVYANGYIREVPHPSLGTLNMVGTPFRLEKTPTVTPRPAPGLGEHTDEVLQEVCGYSSAEIAGLREAGVI
jgi:crotonobetainyl-CoA:carnitine CoA-transferase CaiB-like acyl-CoA transferase